MLTPQIKTTDYITFNTCRVNSFKQNWKIFTDLAETMTKSKRKFTSYDEKIEDFICFRSVKFNITMEFYNKNSKLFLLEIENYKSGAILYGIIVSCMLC